MQVEIISEDKGEAEIQMDSQTVAEILRVYLNEQGVEFAAWRRDHPSKPIILKIKASSGVKKAVSSAIAGINKDCSALVNELKK
ncbi:MAG: RpoL/Rpb11 RNA polymerase subunit family protein [Nanoarchaeota archaeon]